MLFIDKWKAPPPNLDPTKTGDLLLTLNQLGYQVQRKSESYNTLPQQLMESLQNQLDDFSDYCDSIVTDHVNSTGKQHGETKSTVQLSEKDNFRTSTDAEAANFSDVEAFVTPSGVKAAIDKVVAQMTGRYQQNDLFPITMMSASKILPSSSYHTGPNDEYIEGPGRMGHLQDTLLAYPNQPENAQHFNIFRSFQITGGKELLYYDTGCVNMGIVPPKLNGEIYTRRADKKQFVTQLENANRTGPFEFTYDPQGELTPPENFESIEIDYDSHNGLLLGSSYDGTQKIIMGNREIVNPSGEDVSEKIWIDMGLIDVTEASPDDPIFRHDGGLYPDDTYSIFNNTMATRQSLPIEIENLITGDDLTVICETFSVGMTWTEVNKAYYMDLNGRLKITDVNDDVHYVNFKVGFNVACSWIDQTQNNLRRDITPLFDFPPTVFDPSNPESANFGYTKLVQKKDLLDVVVHPGHVFGGGFISRIQTFKSHSVIHYTQTSCSGLLDYIETPINEITGFYAGSKLIAYSEASPFGSNTQRCFAVSYSDQGLTYLTRSLDNSTGGFKWLTLNWYDKTQTNPAPNTINYKCPDFVSEFGLKSLIPSSIVNTVTADSVNVSGWAFTEWNNYTGINGLSYSNSEFINTGDIIFSRVSLNLLNTVEEEFMGRAKGFYNNTFVESFMSFKKHVFGVGDYCVCVLTDGYGYAEVALTPYSVVNGIYSITVAVDDVHWSAITKTPGTPLVSGSEESSLGEVIIENFSDLMVYDNEDGTYDMSMNRPWGSLYGKLAFTISNIDEETLACDVDEVTYIEKQLFDHKDINGEVYTQNINELDYPNTPEYFNQRIVDIPELITQDFCIPGKGLITSDRQYKSSSPRVLEHSVVGTEDKLGFDVNDGQTLIVPSGYPLVLSGRAMKMNRNCGINTTEEVGVKQALYLKRVGNDINPIVSVPGVELEPRFDIVRVDDGGPTNVLNDDYLTIFGLTMSEERKGSTFPITNFEGSDGELTWFKSSDV